MSEVPLYWLDSYARPLYFTVSCEDFLSARYPCTSRADAVDGIPRAEDAAIFMPITFLMSEAPL